MSAPRLPGSGKRKPAAPVAGGMVTLTCDYCGCTFERKAHYAARSKRDGKRVYCSRLHAKIALKAKATGVRGTGAMATAPRRSQIMPPSRAVKQAAAVRDAARCQPQPGRDVDRAGAPRVKVDVVPVDKRRSVW